MKRLVLTLSISFLFLIPSAEGSIRDCFGLLKRNAPPKARPLEAPAATEFDQEFQPRDEPLGIGRLFLGSSTLLQPLNTNEQPESVVVAADEPNKVFPEQGNYGSDPQAPQTAPIIQADGDEIGREVQVNGSETEPILGSGAESSDFFADVTSDSSGDPVPRSPLRPSFQEFMDSIESERNGLFRDIKENWIHFEQGEVAEARYHELIDRTIQIFVFEPSTEPENFDYVLYEGRVTKIEERPPPESDEPIWFVDLVDEEGGKGTFPLFSEKGMVLVPKDLFSEEDDLILGPDQVIDLPANESGQLSMNGNGWHSRMEEARDRFKLDIPVVWARMQYDSRPNAPKTALDDPRRLIDLPVVILNPRPDDSISLRDDTAPRRSSLFLTPLPGDHPSDSPSRATSLLSQTKTVDGRPGFESSPMPGAQNKGNKKIHVGIVLKVDPIEGTAEWKVLLETPEGQKVEIVLTEKSTIDVATPTPPSVVKAFSESGPETDYTSVTPDKISSLPLGLTYYFNDSSEQFAERRALAKLKTLHPASWKPVDTSNFKDSSKTDAARDSAMSLIGSYIVGLDRSGIKGEILFFAGRVVEVKEPQSSDNETRNVVIWTAIIDGPLGRIEVPINFSKGLLQFIEP